MAFTSILFLCEHRWAKKRKRRKLSYLRREKRTRILVLLPRSGIDAQSSPAPHWSSSHWCGICGRNVAMISSSACKVPVMSGCLLISLMYAEDELKEYVPGNLNSFDPSYQIKRRYYCEAWIYCLSFYKKKAQELICRFLWTMFFSLAGSAFFPFFFEKVNFIQSLNTKYRDGAKIAPFKVFQSHLVKWLHENKQELGMDWHGLVLRSHWTGWHLAGHSAYVYMSL